MTKVTPAARCAALLILLACATTSAGAQLAQERAQLESLTRRADERIQALQQEAAELASRERTLLGDLRGLELERRMKTEELNRIEGDLQQATDTLSEVEARGVELERAASAQRPEVHARLRELYKLGRPGYLRLLLDLQDFTSVMRAYQTVAMLAERDRRTIEEHRATLAAVQASHAALAAQRDEMVALQAEARRTRRALDRAVAAQTQLIESIDVRQDLTAQLTGELQIARGRLQASLASLAVGGPASSGPIPLPLRPFRGELRWPVSDTGADTQPAGGDAQPGIEISTPEGRPATAVHGGDVAFAGPFSGFGNLVIVDHGSRAYSLYGYLSAIEVVRGTVVQAGQVVGRVGLSPAGVAALYFELRIDGEPVNPIEWLAR